MNLWDLKIKEYLSFEPDEHPHGKYSLLKLDEIYIEKFTSDIEKIESNPSMLMCLRGDSSESEIAHDNFFKKELSNFFMIGNKAQSYYRTKLPDDFEYYQGKNRDEILLEITELINKCNNEIISKPGHHDIKGTIPNTFIEILRLKNENELEHWRLFFISFLHTNGKGTEYKKFKDYSPFLSMTYGSNKKSIARKFAIKRVNHHKGLIYIIAVNTIKRDYIKTQDLISELAALGVKWYPDVNSECMLLNGAFPHNILGIMEVRKTSTPKLVINPWLFKEYKNDRLFNIENGIPVNQDYLDQWFERDKFKRCFYEDYQGDQYMSEINQASDIRKINKFS